MARRRRSQKKIDSEFVIITIFAAVFIFSFIYQKIKEYPEILVIAIFGILILVAIFIFKRENKRIEYKKRLEKLAKLIPSDQRQDYIVGDEDYKRGNKIESNYRKRYVMRLLSIYGNRCAKCGCMDNNIEIDHFIISKNAGGNFLLRHREQYLVNNAVPLCKPCNGRKSDKSYKEFYDDHEILAIFEKNRKMTLIVNDQSID